MDLVVGAGSLTGELVAGYVDNLKALVVILLVHLLDRLIVGRKAAACSCVDDEHDLALVVREGILVA